MILALFYVDITITTQYMVIVHIRFNYKIKLDSISY